MVPWERGCVRSWSESVSPPAFGGDPALQLSEREIALPGAKRVLCLKTAMAAFDAIVRQGEGAPGHTVGSHFDRFCAIRAEYRAMKAANVGFSPSFPAATNPVLRRPPRPEGRVWLEYEPAIATVDLANASYGLMLRLLGYSYSVAAPHPDKTLAFDLAVGLMRAAASLGQHAARLPAGPSNPNCNAGMSFTTGNLEITSGTGRVVARVTSARLCRCGGSATKPFCDGTHAHIGFRS